MIGVSKKILNCLPLFLLLSAGFFYSLDAKAGDGTCFCTTGSVVMEAEYGKEQCEAEKPQCQWSENTATGMCKCDVTENEQTIDHTEYSSLEAECILSKSEGGKEYNCSWEAKTKSESPPTAGEGAEAEIDIPPVAGLNTLESTDVKVIFGGIIRVGVGLIGSITLALFAYAGVLWMLSGGNAEQATKARNILIWATLGLFVILASYTIVSFIFSAVE